jgi:hypothetical protein
MQKPNRIVGAGLSGLLAAYAFPGIPLIERAPAPVQSHRAVLRFRSEMVSDLTGIPFRRITVRKGLWAEGSFREPTIAYANAYARKTLGYLAADRSIWNLAAANRFIAPENFYDQLVEHAGSRVAFGTADDFRNGPLISTAPLPVVAAATKTEAPELRRAPIYVTRYRVPDCDLYQTVYFPSSKLSVYRASITGSLLIVESIGSLGQLDFDAVRLAFGIDPAACNPFEADMTVRQDFGKIVPLAEGDRKRILFDLTHWHNIYSVGRFACWRNILLDDVVQDLDVIKRLLNSASPAFDAARARAK